MPLRNLSIAKKGLLVLLVPLLYQGVLLGMVIKRQRDQTEAQRWVLHTKDILAQVDEIDRTALHLQGAFRGFALTDNAIFVEESEGAIQALPAMTKKLVDLTQELSPEQRGRVARIREIVDERIAWHRSIFETIRAGNKAQALDRIRNLEGQKIMESLRREVDQFLAAASQLDNARLTELAQTTRTQDRLLLGGLALSVAVALGTSLFFGYNITRRVDLLAKNARRFARGEKLEALGGGDDELALLDRALHDMSRDLTDARQRERAAQHAAERRALELEHVNRDLDHKNQENEMFVYSVSHDLRSPLVNLQGFSKELGLVRDDLLTLFGQEWTERTKARAVQMVDRDISESIHYIQAAVMRLSGIIDALLRLSRAGRVDYHPEAVELGPVVQRIATALRSSIQERKAKLTIKPLPLVWADPTTVEQIFANLVANAVNYLDSQRPGEIEVGQCETLPAESEGLATFYVKDNGMGIAEAYLPKVFAMFQRLHAQAAQGEGVGLTLVKRMVERHGGRIWVDSRAGEGSTFFVALPEREDSPLVVAPKKESIRVKPAPAASK